MYSGDNKCYLCIHKTELIYSNATLTFPQKGKYNYNYINYKVTEIMVIMKYGMKNDKYGT